MTEPLRVAVIGAGLMGSQIGCEYALGGHAVTYFVRSAERSGPRIDHAFELAAGAGLVEPARAKELAAEVGIVEQIEALHAETELVVESIPEDLGLKGEVLGAAARHLPQAIIASNTSSIPITDLGAATEAPERTIGTHYWNPPLLMPPVEIVSGAHTDPEIAARVREVVEDLGKEPVRVQRDVPGFVWNRLQMALLREVLWLVENGVASAREVDQVVRSGLARRYRYTGPFETIALGGIDAWSRVTANLFPVLSRAEEAGGLERWIDYSPAELEAARTRRDRGLARELASDGAQKPSKD
jgi:3-hydroxyacyl-CoA dehydrogenase